MQNRNKSIPINEIIGTIPEELSELEKIRYVYIKLGKFFRYNVDIVFTDEEELRKMYYKKIDINNIDDRRKLCSQIATALAEALNREIEGVMATTMIRRRLDKDAQEIEHVATKVQTSDGCKYIMDLTADLHRVQNKLCTKEFRICNLY